MAVDTAAKRYSMMNLGRVPGAILFAPDSSVDPADRAHLLKLYTGISLTTANPPLEAETGTFTLAGQAVTFSKNSVLSADTGEFIFTGQDAGLAKTFNLAAETGAFTLTGYDITTSYSRGLYADTGAYTLTGGAITLTLPARWTVIEKQESADTIPALWSEAIFSDMIFSGEIDGNLWYENRESTGTWTVQTKNVTNWS